MADLDYKSIIDSFSLAMFVAAPVKDETGKISDFRIEYANPQFLTLVHDVVRPGMFYSQVKSLINPGCHILGFRGYLFSIYIDIRLIVGSLEV